jgi:NAD(P)H-hydrate epimerase
MSFRRLTRAQVREIDRRATAEYGIPSIVLMENAARSAADVAMQMLDGIVPEREAASVDILCGGGNNGGDGLAVARQLHNRGIHVQIIAAWTRDLTGDAAINWQIIQAMKLPTVPVEDADIDIDAGQTDLIIDALFGTGLTRPIGGTLATLIEKVLNPSTIPILAIDVPSGLDCDTGEPLGPCIRAMRTVTFVASKKGFDNPKARDYTGFISIGDIGVPPELVKAVLLT